VPAVVHNGVVFSAGYTPRRDGRLIAQGLVGVDLDVPAARDAAAVAALNALAAVAEAAGGLENVRTCLRMTVYVACVDTFTDLPAVADGASAALESHVGPARLPARSAIGVRALPGHAPVEVELTVGVTSGDREQG